MEHRLPALGYRLGVVAFNHGCNLPFMLKPPQHPPPCCVGDLGCDVVQPGGLKPQTSRYFLLGRLFAFSGRLVNRQNEGPFQVFGLDRQECQSMVAEHKKPIHIFFETLATKTTDENRPAGTLQARNGGN